jgi:hypothetical protein
MTQKLKDLKSADKSPAYSSIELTRAMRFSGNSDFLKALRIIDFLTLDSVGDLLYNVNRRLAFEGEVNYFPSSPTVNELVAAGKFANVPYSGGKKAQFLGGVKYGFRHSKYGFFGKIRPGAIRFTAYPKVAGRFVSPMSDDVLVFSTEVPATFFNVDVGGVFEYYPNRRTVFRVDVGDTIIRYNAQQPKEINPSFTRHNLQTSVGFGFRF